jgi:hypothetical protein
MTEIKEVTKQLLINLRDKLSFESNQKQETCPRGKDAIGRSPCYAIDDTLVCLPENYYYELLYDQNIKAVYRHIYESYYGR